MQSTYLVETGVEFSDDSEYDWTDDSLSTSPLLTTRPTSKDLVIPVSSNVTSTSSSLLVSPPTPDGAVSVDGVAEAQVEPSLAQQLDDLGLADKEEYTPTDTSDSMTRTRNVLRLGTASSSAAISLGRTTSSQTTTPSTGRRGGRPPASARAVPQSEESEAFTASGSEGSEGDSTDEDEGISSDDSQVGF